MEKLKIAITQGRETSEEFFHNAFEDPTLFELCTPITYDSADSMKAALQDLEEGNVDALVYAPTEEPVKCPADATEVVVTEKACFMPLTKEPTEEDIVKLRDILERDFDIRNPRIAIVQENSMQNPELASQVTTEQSINTYGPYTSEQIQNEDIACHFDGIIIPEDSTLVSNVSQEVPVRYFAGREEVVTAPYSSGQTDEMEEVSKLTHPIYTAIDIVRNRAFYDEARQDPLPKLFRDKREDRKQNEAPQAIPNNETIENTEQAS